MAELHEAVQSLEEREVVLEAFPEPDSGIERDGIRRHPRRFKDLDTFREEGSHLPHDIGVPGMLLHRLRVAEHMHRHDTKLVRGNEAYHRGVLQPRYVVDDGRARLDGL